MSCRVCGSHAINHGSHGRDGSDPDLCDVCFWRKRAGDLPQLAVLVTRTRCVFPVALRKMWSGREVQQWIDQNILRRWHD